MLQDFHFKIIHRAGAKHANVDVLSRNLVGKYGANENFGSKIQDLDRMAKMFPCLPLLKELKLSTIFSL